MCESDLAADPPPRQVRATLRVFGPDCEPPGPDGEPCLVGLSTVFSTGVRTVAGPDGEPCFGLTLNRG